MKTTNSLWTSLYFTVNLSSLTRVTFFSFQYSFISMYLVNSFSQIIDLSNKISDIAGYTHRLVLCPHSQSSL